MFDRSKELPGDVFRIQGRNWFFDGHRMFGDEMWDALNELSRLYGDSEIALVVDDPDHYDLATWASPPVHSIPAPGPPDLYSEARRAGATWDQIGDALGMSRQGAWEYFAKRAQDRLAESAALSEDLSEDEAMQLAVEEVRAVRRERRAGR